MARIFELYRMSDADKKAVATVTIDAPNLAGAEQNLVVLDDSGRALAVLELQPGIDRKEVQS